MVDPDRDAYGAPAREERPARASITRLHDAGGMTNDSSWFSGSVGIFRSAIADQSAPAGGEPPYVERDEDGVLRSSVKSNFFTLVTGPGSCGKARSALEAIRRTFPEARLLIPHRRNVCLSSPSRSLAQPRPAK